MTRRELVKNAIAHVGGERAPYCIHFCPDGKERLKEAVGEVEIDAFIDNDVLHVSPPWWGWGPLEEDWRGDAPPTSRAAVLGRGSYDEFFEQLKRLRDETDKYILVMIYGSHFEKAYSARGIENFLADMGAAPDFARSFCRRIIEKNLVMLENFLAAPEIDGVLLGSDWGSQRDLLMSPQSWEDLLRPGEQEEYDLVHSYGKDVWVHSCGNVERLIPALIEMGLDVLNPVQPEAMDIGRLKADYGAKLAFWGGISTQQTLPYGTPDEVKEEARRVRDLMAVDGGYILAPSQEIQGDVPAENILALLEVAREPLPWS